VIIIFPLIGISTLEFIDFYASAAGFCFALLILWSGVGAGVLVIPTLITVFHLDPLVAIASGSAFAFISKIMMTIGHAKQGSVDWTAAYHFLRICLPVTVITAALMAYLSTSQPSVTLELFLIGAILVAGCLALFALLSARVKAIISHWPMVRLSGTTGLLMGLTGVGGGIMVVPALATSGGLAIKAAVATSIPVGLILSLAVSITLGSSGHLDYGLIASLVIGAAVAIPIGTRLFHRFSDDLVRRVTCLLISIALIDLAFNAINLALQLSR
jgi:uncharacterized membrane protein YfcA